MRYEAQRMASNSVGNWLVVVWVGRGWLRLTRHLGPFCPFFTGGGRERLRGPVLYQTPRGALVRYGGHGVRGRGVKEMKSQEEKSKLR